MLVVEAAGHTVATFVGIRLKAIPIYASWIFKEEEYATPKALFFLFDRYLRNAIGYQHGNGR
jgi:hypothetical protein